jgi:hypothetical protein
VAQHQAAIGDGGSKSPYGDAGLKPSWRGGGVRAAISGNVSAIIGWRIENS